MNEFVLLFRMDISPGAQPAPQQMQQYMKDWMAWINDIEANGSLSGGNHMMPAGKVVMPGGKVSDGVYTKDKESVAGYITVLAKDMDEALRIAKQCPILHGDGNSVEVRQTATPGS